MSSENATGCAVNLDGSLKDAADIDFVYSESEDPHPPAATITLPPRSTRPDRLTQTRFNLANSSKRSGPSLVISGVRQVEKRKANSTMASNLPRKSQKTSNAAASSQKCRKRATVPESDHDDLSDGYVNSNSIDNSDDEDAAEDSDEVTKYERLRQEGEHDRTVRRHFLMSLLCSYNFRNLPNDAVEAIHEVMISDLSLLWKPG
jgi:hypothetical protein